MRLSQNGQICVMTSDGFANLVNADNLKPLLKPKKLHNMPITSCAFKADNNTLVTASTDYTYKFTRMSDFSAITSLQGMIFRFGILFLILVFLADYLY